MKHNAVTGNPNSASSQRMQTDVQRNANQERRIHQGAQSRALTTKEAGTRERSQARTDRKEAKAVADGHIGTRGQAGIQNRENRQRAVEHSCSLCTVRNPNYTSKFDRPPEIQPVVLS